MASEHSRQTRTATTRRTSDPRKDSGSRRKRMHFGVTVASGNQPEDDTGGAANYHERGMDNYRCTVVPTVNDELQRGGGCATGMTKDVACG